MNALVVYDSQYGNTERIAQTIADTLHAAGQARAVRVGQAQPAEVQQLDLLVVGCPTQGWKPTPALQSFVDTIPAEQLRELAVACFDTRINMPRWMTGSAANVIDKQLHKLGVAPLMPAESFFVAGGEGPLQEGELDRAAAWTRILIEKVAAARAVVY